VASDPRDYDSGLRKIIARSAFLCDAALFLDRWRLPSLDSYLHSRQVRADKAIVRNPCHAQRVIFRSPGEQHLVKVEEKGYTSSLESGQERSNDNRAASVRMRVELDEMSFK